MRESRVEQAAPGCSLAALGEAKGLCTNKIFLAESSERKRSHIHHRAPSPPTSPYPELDALGVERRVLDILSQQPGEDRRDDTFEHRLSTALPATPAAASLEAR